MDSLALGVLVRNLPANILPKPCPSVFFFGLQLIVTRAFPCTLGWFYLSLYLGTSLNRASPFTPFMVLMSQWQWLTGRAECKELVGNWDHLPRIFRRKIVGDDRESLTPEKPAMQSCRDFVLAAASPASKDALSPSRPHLFSWHCSALYQSRFNFLSKFKKTFIARVSYYFRCEIRQWILT